MNIFYFTSFLQTIKVEIVNIHMILLALFCLFLGLQHWALGTKGILKMKSFNIKKAKTL